MHLVACQLQILSQPIRKFRREADLHGTTVRALVVQRREHTFAMLHCMFSCLAHAVATAGVYCTL
jgi:hypothetical protein